MKLFSHCVLAITLLAISGHSQTNQTLNGKSLDNMLSTDEWNAKGGVGVVIRDLYIDLRGPKNSLLFDRDKTWKGRDSNSYELVIFFDNRVLSTETLPRQFDLSKATVISFEGPVVRFFDFNRMTGGYYKRSKP